MESPQIPCFTSARRNGKRTQPVPPPEDESDDTVSSVDLVREETTLLPQAQSAGHVPDLYEVLEAATAQLQGIRAICTADAISQLWNWSSRDNLLRARSAIDHLIKRME